MSDQLRYDGKIVLITGAGNGLGRAYALLFAARGAQVVVNDLGGGIHGSGSSASAADNVVAEIRAAGGQAVASYDSVTDGAAIVRTAVEAFGALDVVINNAGILRDASFQKMTEQEWQGVLSVHLQGAFRVTHAAWPVLRQRGYGRVIFTASAAGLYGNFGQANYSAAKLGTYGLARSLAVEGRSKNILVNTIAPIAGSRLTETIMPPELIRALKPELVSPLVGWLCHERCRETGNLFEVGAGYFAKVRWERTRGSTFGTGREVSPEDIEAQWGRIVDFSDAEHPNTVDDTFAVINASLQKKPPARTEALIDLQIATEASAVYHTSHGERDISLYALGVGAGENPADPRELALVYERDPSFTPLPTWAVIPAGNMLVEKMQAGEGVLPGLNFGFDRLLHGEQYTEIRAPLPSAGRLTHTFRLKAAYDKKPHAVLILAATTVDENNTEVAYNEFTCFVRGAGGWGGARGPSGAAGSGGSSLAGGRDPDIVTEEYVAAKQALLYRLCGDLNPLHVDPAFARAMGYNQPLLHGLCAYGYAGRHLINAFCGYDPRRLKSLRARFSEVFFPGETLVSRMWQESPERVEFEVWSKERGVAVIRNGVAQIGPAQACS